MRGWRNRRTARTDRWNRENEAPRLKDEVPHVQTLRFDLEEWSGGHPVAGTSRVRHIVVAQAAALFEIACGDSKCEEGTHDLTSQVIPKLQSREAEFNGESTCQGQIGDRPCERVLKYSARAEYKA